MENCAPGLVYTRKTWLSGMSPVAAECVSAARAVGPAALDPEEDDAAGADEGAGDEEDVAGDEEDVAGDAVLELFAEEPQPATAAAASSSPAVNVI
jgi:hypothetical protein